MYDPGRPWPGPISPPRPSSPGVLDTGSGAQGPCPQGMVSSGSAPCPPGCTETGRSMGSRGGYCCCPPGGSRGGGGRGGPGGGGWRPGSVERPNLTPINPQAEYDPEMARALADQRAYQGNLLEGAGQHMDVMVGRMADQLEAQVAQARAGAQAAGIPFDEAAFRAQAQRDLNAGMVQEKSNREATYGEALKTGGQMAGAQAGERTQRMDIDLRRDVSENELALDRYGRDIQKYGIDAQASTAANNAILDFWSRLMSGMFSQMGSMSMNNTNYYS